MRRARQERTVSRHAIAEPAAGQVNGAIANARDFGRSSTSMVEPPVAEILLSPSCTFANEAVAESDGRCERRRQLAIAIRQRIEAVDDISREPITRRVVNIINPATSIDARQRPAYLGFYHAR